ncbi:MAG: TonB-dependent receptor plug domain-containing protein, partial [Bacteroidota bacterium]
MRKSFFFLIIFTLLLQFLPFIVFSQGRSVTGQVLNEEDSKPIAAVTVLNETTRLTTQTDDNGNFSLAASKGQVLVLTHIVFGSKRYTVTDDAHIILTLQQAQGTLNDVVVVGYGSQKKANLTGAVSSVDVTKTFASKPLNDPTKALQGIVPGLTIVYGNGGLTAGADVKIRGIGSINGSSRPLILVDNVQTDDLSIINPQDIESISVLKDAASASIYGARAAFGVVLIKTKSGKKNQKSTVTYTNNFSWNKATVMPKFSDPVPELQALNDAGVRSGTSSPETFGMNLLKLRDGIINWQKNYAGKNGTEMVKGEDWNIEPDGRTYFYKVWDPNKEVLNKYTFSQLHNINFSGGSDKLAYYLSMGYSKDGGIIKLNPDAVEKYNITVGLNASVTKWLDVSAKTMYRNYSYDYPYEYQNYWYYHWRWGSYFPYGTYQGNYFRVNSAYLAAASKSNLSDNYQRLDLGATIKINSKLSIRADYTIGRDNALRHES